jgi:hypothetical protein
MKLIKILSLLATTCVLLSCSGESTETNKSSSTPKPEGEQIPRSTTENAKYYLISVEPDGEYLRSMHSRISSMSYGYSVTRINCKAKQYQDLGYGENSRTNIKMYNNTQWENLVTGSSKYDLVSYACTKATL